MEKRKIFESDISVGRFGEFIDEIFRLVNNKIKSYVCFANVHMVVEAYRRPAFQAVLNSANVVAPDGRPLGIFLRLFERQKQDRVCGMDLFPELLRVAAAEGKSVYLYGGAPVVQQLILDRIARELPQLRVAGFRSPPYRPLTDEERAADVAHINECAPDILFVSLGCPRQEVWAAEHRDKLNTCIVAIGQAFMVYAGVEKRLPQWMRNLSLEWAYRLYQEPRRLMKRYFITNSLFLYLAAQQALARIGRTILSPAKLTGNGSPLR